MKLIPLTLICGLCLVSWVEANENPKALKNEDQLTQVVTEIDKAKIDPKVLTQAREKTEIKKNHSTNNSQIKENKAKTKTDNNTKGKHDHKKALSQSKQKEKPAAHPKKHDAETKPSIKQDPKVQNSPKEDSIEGSGSKLEVGTKSPSNLEVGAQNSDKAEANQHDNLAQPEVNQQGHSVQPEPKQAIETSHNDLSNEFPSKSQTETLQETDQKEVEQNLVNNKIDSEQDKVVPITKIKVENNTRLPDSSIISFSALKIGNTCSDSSLNTAIKKVYGTGYFANVTAKCDIKGVATISVTSQYIVNQVAFEGNNKISDKDLLGVISLDSRASYSEHKIQSDMTKIVAEYHKRGMYTTIVSPKMIKLDHTRVNVIYIISEGDKAKIQKINLIGNKSFSSKSLKEVIISREAAWFRLFSSSDMFEHNKMEMDKILLTQHYNDNGYAEFKITNVISELSKDHKGFIVTFVMDEGKKYNLGKISVDNNVPELKDADLYQIANNLKTGDVFNRSRIDAVLESMLQYTGRVGYVFTQIVPEFKTNSDTQKVDIAFKVRKGSRVYVNKIDIVDNVRTMDKVIRRELLIQEGDPFNLELLNISENRLNRLGYFSTVSIKPEIISFNKENSLIDDDDSQKLSLTNPVIDHPTLPYSTDKVNLKVHVKERSTGKLDFKIEYNGSQGATLGVSGGEDNVLGTGKTVDFSIQRGKRSFKTVVGASDPRFMDKNLMVGFDVFYMTEVPEIGSVSGAQDRKYRSQQYGISLKTGYSLSDYWYQTLNYTISKNNMRGVELNSSEYIKAQPRKRLISSIGHSTTYNKLNGVTLPTGGYKFRLSQDFAGIGGDEKFVRHRIYASYYHPIYKQDIIFGAIAKAGFIHGYGGNQVDLTDGFLIGHESFAGFDASGIGPRDKKTGDSLAAKKYYTGIAQVTFPIGVKDLGLRGIVFNEIGSAFDIDIPKTTPALALDGFYNDRYMRASYGAGIIWDSPLGTVRVDYTKAYRKKPYDQTKHFRLVIGGSEDD